MRNCGLIYTNIRLMSQNVTAVNVTVKNVIVEQKCQFVYLNIKNKNGPEVESCGIPNEYIKMKGKYAINDKFHILKHFK